MTQPPCLKAGDSVSIIAPSKKIPPYSLKEARAILESWGLKVYFGKNLFNEHHQFAGTDQERLEDLQEALDSKEIKAIFCARGGYGLTRILDYCSFTHFTEQPKWIIGFSDITALHLSLTKKETASIHGPMPLLFSTTTDDSLRKLKALLFGEGIIHHLPSHPENRQGEAKGILTGGNLSLITHCLGSASEIDCYEKILFLEEVDEYLYAVDRMINQLYRAGKLHHLRGLIIGHFSKMKEQETPFGYSIEKIIKNWVSEFSFPVAFGMPAGHEEQNHPVILGKEAILRVESKGSTLQQQGIFYSS